MKTQPANRWVILAASCFVTLCIGSLYAWSAFSGPMAEWLAECMGAPVDSLAMVFTVANAVGPVTMIAGGAVNDRLGPKKVLLLGGLLFGGGMIGSGFVRNVWTLIVSYGLGVGLGVGLIYGVTVSNTVKFFPDKAGLAGGVITACYGASSMIVPPAAAALTRSYGVNAAFWIIGAVMSAILCASALVICPCPAEFSAARPEEARNGGKDRELRWNEMLREPEFYLMLLALTCGAFAGMMVISQASQLAQELMGLGVTGSALMVSAVALFNALGRLASGALSDRLGATGTLRLTLLLSCGANLLLFLSGGKSLWLTGASLGVVGFSFGSIMGVYPGFTAARFGRSGNSVNYGIMFIGFALAGLLGPMLMNRIRAGMGRCQPAFLAAAVLAAGGETLILVLHSRLHRERQCAVPLAEDRSN